MLRPGEFAGPTHGALVARLLPGSHNSSKGSSNSSGTSSSNSGSSSSSSSNSGNGSGSGSTSGSSSSGAAASQALLDYRHNAEQPSCAKCTRLQHKTWVWRSLGASEQARFLTDLQGASEGQSNISPSGSSSTRSNSEKGQNGGNRRAGSKNGTGSSSSHSSLLHVLAVSGEEIMQETRDIQCERDRDLVFEALRCVQQQQPLQGYSHDESSSSSSKSKIDCSGSNGNDCSGGGGSTDNTAQLHITDSVSLHIGPSSQRSRKTGNSSSGNGSSFGTVAMLDHPLTMNQMAELQALVARAGSAVPSVDRVERGKDEEVSLRDTTKVSPSNSLRKWTITEEELFYPPAELFEAECGSALGLNDDHRRHQQDSLAVAGINGNAGAAAAENDDGDSQTSPEAAVAARSQRTVAEQQKQFANSGPFAHEMRRARTAAAAVALSSVLPSAGTEKYQQLPSLSPSSSSSLLSWSSAWSSSSTSSSASSSTSSSSASTSESPLASASTSTFGHAMLEQLALLRHQAQKAQVFQQHLATAYEAEQAQHQQQQRGRDSDSSSSSSNSSLAGLSSLMGSSSSYGSSSSNSSERHHRLRQLIQQVDLHCGMHIRTIRCCVPNACMCVVVFYFCFAKEIRLI